MRADRLIAFLLVLILMASAPAMAQTSQILIDQDGLTMAMISSELSDVYLRFDVIIENDTGHPLFMLFENAYADGVEVIGIGIFDVGTEGQTEDYFFFMPTEGDDMEVLEDIDELTFDIEVLNNDTNELLFTVPTTLRNNGDGFSVGDGSSVEDALGSALAAEYEPTRLFLEALEEDDFFLEDYDVSAVERDMDDNGNELVAVQLNIEGLPDNVVIYFRDTETSCSMYMWDVIHFDPADREELLELINGFNNDYRYVRWYLMDDDTVNAQIDPIFRTGDGCGESLVETLSMLIRVAEVCLPELELYAV